MGSVAPRGEDKPAGISCSPGVKIAWVGDISWKILAPHVPHPRGQAIQGCQINSYTGTERNLGGFNFHGMQMSMDEHFPLKVPCEEGDNVGGASLYVYM